MTERTSKEIELLNFEGVQLSEKNPVKDYINLLNKKMRSNDIVSDDVIRECFENISSIVQAYVWKVLFLNENHTKEDLKLAADLLSEHKRDAGFYNPWDYNVWITTVRDELLKRKMLDFWLNEIVKRELGPCWARDSDLFDDADDTKPAEFYNHAGGKAPWLQEQHSSNIEGATQGSVHEINMANEMPSKPKSKANTESKIEFKKISLQTPLEDYRYNMSLQDDLNPDDMAGREKILKEGQQIIWQLLFSDSNLSQDNFVKAAQLLKAIKEDSCLFSPYTYNDWIVTVRDELINRRYNDFWENIIVKQKMGLCCYTDSEYFSDAEDEKPLEFYKSFEKIMFEKHK